MCMAAVDDLRAHVDDKPTIGLLLCRSKNHVVAEYAMLDHSGAQHLLDIESGISLSVASMNSRVSSSADPKSMRAPSLVFPHDRPAAFCDTGGGVKSDRLPYPVLTLRRPPAIVQEPDGGVGALNLESLRPVVLRGGTRVVEQAGNEQGLQIDIPLRSTPRQPAPE